MIPQEALNIMYDEAVNYMDNYVDEIEFTEDIVNGDFPVVVVLEEKYYRSDFVATILASDYITLCVDSYEITVDDYIEFRKQVRPFDFYYLN